MSNRSLVAADTVIPLAPKSNVKPETGDPLDRAAQAILGLVHRTANDAKAKNQQTLAVTLSITPLNFGLLKTEYGTLRQTREITRTGQTGPSDGRNQISAEIEQLFFGRDHSRPSQPPPPQALLRNQRQ